MRNTIYITGHKNPDADSICSSIAYAELKKKQGLNAVPIRLGEINKETDFILKYFNIRAPEYVNTVKTQVYDLDRDIISPVSPEISIKTAWDLMKRNNYKVLPVVDENDIFLGIITLSHITNNYMETIESNATALSKTPLENIVETLNAKLVFGDYNTFNTTGKTYVAAMTPDEMKNFIGSGDIVLVGNRKDSQLSALELGTSCLIITCSGNVEEDVLGFAKKNNCAVMVTPWDTFSAARLINLSAPIGQIMTSSDIISFNPEDYLDEVKEKMLKSRYRSYPVLDDNGVFCGFISRFHLISKKRKKIILLDHNEKSQSVDSIEQAEILEIIDHHRIGDIQTLNPVYFFNKPVGSTATIIADMFFKNGIKPSNKVAGILCAAIVSDTLKFKSPTSTHVDVEIAKKLSNIAGIDIEEFAHLIFKAGSTLIGRTANDIIFNDFKEYNLGKHSIGIGQINVTDSESINEIRDELLQFMDDISAERHLGLLMMMITDIVNEGSEILFRGKDSELIEKAFNVEPGKDSVFMPGMISRKKQVVPFIAAQVQ